MGEGGGYGPGRSIFALELNLTVTRNIYTVVNGHVW